jgi:hypothetical protein
MGTSKLSKDVRTWIGGVSIFSGRPDPTWQVEKAVAQKLVDLWGLLEPFRGKCPSAPPLGYRGCFLRSATGQEWIAYRGVVTLKTDVGYEPRIDKDGKFEKLLLSSAPEGVLPTSLLKDK